MPEVRVGARVITVAPGSNLLDSLNHAGLTVPYSCRAGSCCACMVRCLSGAPDDAQPEALNSQQRAAGWCLACQCQVVGDLELALFDPAVDAQQACVQACDWLSEQVLRLRLSLERPLRYQAGQYVNLWLHGVGRAYSLASVPNQDPWLEFHIQCSRPGAFVDAARLLQVGDRLGVGAVQGGALHYDRQWQEQPLYLLASGTGLAPLWGVLQEALMQQHQAPILLYHLAASEAEHYLAQPLQALAQEHKQLQLYWLQPANISTALAQLKLVSRQSVALLCGSPEAVEVFSKRLFLAGLPRRQIHQEAFVSRVIS